LGGICVVVKCAFLEPHAGASEVGDDTAATTHGASESSNGNDVLIATKTTYYATSSTHPTVSSKNCDFNVRRIDQFILLESSGHIYSRSSSSTSPSFASAWFLIGLVGQLFGVPTEFCSPSGRLFSAASSLGSAIDAAPASLA